MPVAFHPALVLVAAFTLVTEVGAQTIAITDAPRAFTVVAPARWTRLPPTTGNSRVRFGSPASTPKVTCSVVVQEPADLRNWTQDEMSEAMRQPPDHVAILARYSTIMDEVRIIASSNGSLLGYPAQVVRLQYSVGSPTGTVYGMEVVTRTMTTPGLSWVVGCGATAKSLPDAQKAFDYWRLEISSFTTFVKLVR